MDIDIDAVAREMTGGEAPAMRGQVLARIDRIESTRSPRLFWRWSPLKAAATLAAMLVVGVGGFLALTPEVVRVELATLALPAPGTSMATPPAPLPVEDARFDPSPRPVATRSVRPAAEPSLSDVEVAWLARAVPALGRPDVPDVDEIQPAAFDIPLLAMTPLEPTPLALPRLDIRRSGTSR